MISRRQFLASSTALTGLTRVQGVPWFDPVPMFSAWCVTSGVLIDEIMVFDHMLDPDEIAMLSGGLPAGAQLVPLFAGPRGTHAQMTFSLPIGRTRQLTIDPDGFRID